MSLRIPAGSVPAAAAPAFNPPSRDVNEYTGNVWHRKDLKVGKYYVMSLYDTPRTGSIVKVTKVTPFPPGTPYAPFGSAMVEVQEEDGTILPQRTTMAFKFFEYQIPLKNIPIPNEMEPSEPLLNANAIRARNAAHREYRERESYRQSKAKYYTRRGRRSSRRQRRRSSRRSH